MRCSICVPPIYKIESGLVKTFLQGLKKVRRFIRLIGHINDSYAVKSGIVCGVQTELPRDDPANRLFTLGEGYYLPLAIHYINHYSQLTWANFNIICIFIY